MGAFPLRWLALCRSLSGFDDVSERFATAAYAALQRQASAQEIAAMLAQFDESGTRALAEDAARQSLVCALITFLYTGFGPDGLPDDEPANHFESLMWRAALAHPPALSGGYFGHWAYPPDEAGR